MELLNLDEIEFFGLLPVSFTNELQEELQACLNDLTQNYHLHHKIQSYISDVFRKNLFIFNNFVLRNILKFPTNFKLERKITDKTIRADVLAMAKDLSQKQNRIIALGTQIYELKKQINIQMDRSNGYKNLLKNKTKFYDCCTGVKEIKAFFKETNELLEKYIAGGKRTDCEFEKLMEYKNIKSEYYKNERNKLVEIADFELLENLNKLI
ncbi:hypothetical protein GINT2_001993 [Glugoides intestinalis]